MLNTNFVWYSKGDSAMTTISYTSNALGKARTHTVGSVGTTPSKAMFSWGRSAWIDAMHEQDLVSINKNRFQVLLSKNIVRCDDFCSLERRVMLE